MSLEAHSLEPETTLFWWRWRKEIVDAIEQRGLLIEDKSRSKDDRQTEGDQ